MGRKNKKKKRSKKHAVQTEQNIPASPLETQQTLHPETALPAVESSVDLQPLIEHELSSPSIAATHVAPTESALATAATEPAESIDAREEEAFAVVVQDYERPESSVFAATAEHRSPPRVWRVVVGGMIACTVVLVIALAIFGDYELETSRLQSLVFSKLSRSSTFVLADGPSDRIRYPSNGPHDVRLGYALLPAFVDELQQKGFIVKAQAKLSEMHARLIDLGIFPLYEPKLQTGLHIIDRSGDPLVYNRYPETYYKRFDDIPTPIVSTLLLIEDRNVLDELHLYRNPAIEWTRFLKAIGDLLRSKVDSSHDVHGGSTLATQLEKFKHSDEGITGSPKEKLRQMLTAAIRAYRDGRITLDARKRIVRDYVNSVPLAALPGFGEINGLGDGLWAYFGAEFNEVNKLLQLPASRETPELLAQQGKAYRQILSLFLAHRRPSELLLGEPQPLKDQVTKYLPFLLKEGIINEALYEAASAADISVRRILPKPPRASFLRRKGPNLVRTHLLQLLALDHLYDLDRLDLKVYSTLDERAQLEVTDVLNRLNDANYVKELNLGGERLLQTSGDLSKVIYSFTLYEKEGNVNKLRIQTDNFDQPFNINEGVKLDLGSTAKLRTLITYLEVIEEIYLETKDLTPPALKKWLDATQDPLSRWVGEFKQQHRTATLREILLAAMERKYSAGPGESFFTAGGMHTFENFSKDDNGKVPSVRESMHRSINLPFIRMMRDIVTYTMFHTSGSTARTLSQMGDISRQEYLSRFADKEGRVFMSRFYRKYSKKSKEEILQTLLEGVERKPRRFAAVFWVLNPQASIEEFSTFMRQSFEDKDFPQSELQKLYETYATRQFSLGDKGYLARTHPLELWVAVYLMQHPGAAMQEVFEKGYDVRQEVYSWLFNKKRRRAQDSRIRTILEQEAFTDIHRRWQRLGYPLDSLVPSLATALGTSADRPDALAQLMGIIVSDGKRLPSIRISKMEFASRTPFATVVENAQDDSRQVLSPEIAQTIREVLIEIVEKGTAVRARGGFTVNGKQFLIGGKTGTGDHRHEVYGAGGRLKESRVVNRTATFVFLLGDRYFGTITAIVRGREAEKFKFTSALPVQLLKQLEPAIAPLLERGEQQANLGPLKLEEAPDSADVVVD